MNITRMTAIAIGLTVVSAGALRAQTQETKTTTKTKVEMKGGKDVTFIGCLERRERFLPIGSQCAGCTPRPDSGTSQ